MPTNFGASTAQPILADLNGDGDLDLLLAATSGSGGFVYLGNGVVGSPPAQRFQVPRYLKRR